MVSFDDIGGKRVTTNQLAQRQRKAAAQRAADLARSKNQVNRGGSSYNRRAALAKRQSSGGGGGGTSYSPSSGSTMGSGNLQAVIDAALAMRGVDYSWGGGGKSGPSYGIEHGSSIRGFDCSGLLQYAFWKGAGIDIGGTSAEQRNRGASVSKDRVQAGDLIYWNRPGVSHIAMYLGNGYMIEAPRTGAQVRVVKVGGKNSLENATSVRRIIQGSESGARNASAQYGGEFERLVYGIRQQESDGRYHLKGAVNADGDRAYGAYQIMGKNVGNWTQEVLGRRMSPNEFLNDTAAQDKVARAKLQQYYNKYGADGAAVAWYAGPGYVSKYRSGENKGAQNGPSVRTYVQEVMGHMGNAPSPLAGDGNYPGSGGTTYNASNNFDADLDRMISEDDMEAAFAAAGYSSFVINSDTELKGIFKKAVQEQWNEARFLQAIKSTKWFRGRSDKQREYDTIRLTDPKTWTDNIHDQEETIRTIANSLGVTLTDARLTQMAKTALRNGFTPDELQRAVAAEFAYDPANSYAGEAGNTINQVRDLAHSYGVLPTKEVMGKEVKRILRGENTIDGLRNDYIKQAKSQYAHFATELDAGTTLEDIATPYMQAMSQVLELNPEDINIHDKTVRQGLARKDAKTNSTSAMALWEYEEYLKNDQRWMQTNNARDSMMGLGSDLLRSFGLKV